jgi:hypothetical protein
VPRQELQQLLSPQCNALQCEALLRMALAKQQRERSSGEGVYGSTGRVGEAWGYGYLMGFIVFPDQKHRQETLNSVGGRKSMCQIQATVSVEQ